MPRTREELQIVIDNTKSDFSRQFGSEDSYTESLTEWLKALIQKRKQIWLSHKLEHLASVDLIELLAQAENRAPPAPVKRVTDHKPSGRRRNFEEAK